MEQTPWKLAYDEAATQADFIDLTDSSFHQNGLIPPRDLFEASFRQWLDQRNYQPDSRGARAARQTLQDFYQQQGCLCQPDDFFLTAGTSEAYSLIFSQFAQAGDEVLLPRPGYPLFEHLAQHSRLKTTYYNQPAALNWQPDIQSVKAAITPQTRFIVMISPNNPTGQILSNSSVEAILHLCEQHQILFICDEVFDAFTYQTPLPRPASLSSQVAGFTLNGISKRFGCPDLKLAWMMVSGPPIWRQKASAQLELTNDLFLSANSFSQFILPHLFQQSSNWQSQTYDLLHGNRQQMSRFLDQQSTIQGILPQGGIHGILHFSDLDPAWDDDQLSLDLLKRKHLNLHPGYFYDIEEPGIWMVYSLLKRPQDFQKALARLSTGG